MYIYIYVLCMCCVYVFKYNIYGGNVPNIGPIFKSQISKR